MVKVAWFLSICVLFVVLVLQFSDALQCPHEKNWKECPSTSSCVVYTCKKDKDGALVRESGGSGCVEDFFNDAKCSSAEAAVAKDFIKKQTFLDMNFYNGYVRYVSGCITASDKRKCILDKSDNFEKEVKDTYKTEKWYSTVVTASPGGGSKSSGDGSKSSDGGSNPSGGGSNPSGNDSDLVETSNNVTRDKSGSNNQNGAFKFIGIIVFGWILFAAA